MHRSALEQQNLENARWGDGAFEPRKRKDRDGTLAHQAPSLSIYTFKAAVSSPRPLLLGICRVLSSVCLVWLCRWDDSYGVLARTNAGGSRAAFDDRPRGQQVPEAIVKTHKQLAYTRQRRLKCARAHFPINLERLPALFRASFRS
jgi:hypothetical protein